MAESKKNVVTYGLSGLVGKMLVFRKRGDKTFVSSRPKVNPNRIPSTIQLAIQEKFKLASIYASGAIKDPVLKSAYEAAATGNQSAFNRAFKDAQLSPSFVGEPNISAYTGTVGEKISVKVIDDFKVFAVMVKIKDSGGVVIEEGEALIDTDQIKWNYTIQTANGSISGTNISFMAYDLPGNESVKEVIL
jgi:hypothetical protein